MNQIQESTGRKMWRILYPLLVYFGCSIVVGLLLAVVMVGQYLRTIPEAGVSYEEMAVVMTEAIMSKALLITLLCDALAIPFMLLFIRMDNKRALCYGIQKKYERPEALSVLGWVVLGIGFCVTENNLLELSGLTQALSEDSQMIAEALYRGGVWFELLVVGLIGPVLEELLFRGVMLRRMNDYMRPLTAMILSSVIFGAFHGNMLQFIYAFLFGLGFAYLYNKFHTVWAPIVAHCAGNITSVLLSETPLLQGIEEGSFGHIMFIVIGALLALGGFGMVYYAKEPVLLTPLSSDEPMQEHIGQ